MGLLLLPTVTANSMILSIDYTPCTILLIGTTKLRLYIFHQLMLREAGIRVAGDDEDNDSNGDGNGNGDDSGDSQGGEVLYVVF